MTAAAAPATAPPPGDVRWTLRLLGGFELAGAGQRHHKLGTRAAMALLAQLCLRPSSTHPRETLVELLWPGVAAEAGRQRLRQTLSTLKQVLEPPGEPGFAVIDADRLNLRLVPGSVWCDAVAFEAAYKRGDHATAHALYAGELLPGFFDEWISDERLRLEGLFDRLRAPPPPPMAAAAAAAAAATTAATPAAASAGPHRAALPAYLTRLIGADPQAAHLKQQVTEHRLVTLMGPGGTGKTRMAVEVAHSLAKNRDGPDAVFEMAVFVPLAPCRSLQQLLDQLLLSLQLPQGKAGALDTAVQALDGRRVLLVLDNFEQVVDDGAEAVGELGLRLPLLHLLVTSRRALAIAGEREITVAALPLPAADATLTDAAANPAVGLFVDRARAARAEFHLHDGNRAAVVELVQLLDGMPLAIELAAARVRSLAPAEMAATLRLARAGHADASALDLLARAPQRGRQDTRHRSMQDTIDWSWQLLTPELRTLLAALTVFQGGFTAAAAAAICAGQRPSAMALQLDELLSHSLLRAQPGVAPDGSGADTLRFGLYEPIREFAQRTLDAAASAALRQRHRAWALAWAQAMPLTPSLPALHAEMPNLVAAMASGTGDDDGHAVIELVLALAPALEEISLPGAAVAALEQAVAVCANPLLKSRGLSILGRLLFRAGRGVDSLRLVEQGLALAPADQPRVRWRALLMAAHAALNSGQRGAPVLALLDEAQAIAEQRHDDDALARIAACRADAVRPTDLALAEALQRDALATWLRRGDRFGVLRTRYSLAILAYHARNYQAMLDAIEPVIAEARQLQAWLRLSASLNVRGTALKALRRWDAAAADLRASLQLAWEALALRETLHALASLQYLMVRGGQADSALQLCGFLHAYWPRHIGPWKADDQREMRQLQRMTQRILGARRASAELATGQQLTVSQAVALALLPPRTTG